MMQRTIKDAARRDINLALHHLEQGHKVTTNLYLASATRRIAAAIRAGVPLDGLESDLSPATDTADQIDPSVEVI